MAWRQSPAKLAPDRTTTAETPMSVTRTDAVARAAARWDDGSFLDQLRQLVAIPSESQEPERRDDLRRYLTDGMEPAFRRMGYDPIRIFDNPDDKGSPFLVA